MTLDDKTLQNAYHEAGHAVLAYLTGICIVEGISLGGEGKHAQAVFTLRGDLKAAKEVHYQEREWDHEMEMAIIFAAGVEAERAWLEGRQLPVDEDALFLGAHQDVQDVERFLGGPGKWLAVTERARFYLAQPKVWLLVDRLATRIAAKGGAIDGAAIEDLLHRLQVEHDLEDFMILC